MPVERETDAQLVRRTMGVLDLSERGMAALLDVTQPTVNGILNGATFLKMPVRQYVQGLLVEYYAIERLASDRATRTEIGACRVAMRNGEVAFVEHARQCPFCIARSYVALNGGRI